MKVSLAKIKKAENGLKRLFNCPELPANKAFEVSEIVDQVMQNLQLVETNRIRLVNKYGLKLKDGTIEVRPDKLQEFQKEMEDILISEIEMDSITLNEDDIKGVKLTPVEFAQIKNIIKIKIDSKSKKHRE